MKRRIPSPEERAMFAECHSIASMAGVDIALSHRCEFYERKYGEALERIEKLEKVLWAAQRAVQIYQYPTIGSHYLAFTSAMSELIGAVKATTDEPAKKCDACGITGRSLGTYTCKDPNPEDDQPMRLCEGCDPNGLEKGG